MQLAYIAYLPWVLMLIAWRWDAKSAAPSPHLEWMATFAAVTVVGVSPAVGLRDEPALRPMGWFSIILSLIVIGFKIWLVIQERSRREVAVAPRVEL